jgi:hypothetical protein
MGRILVKEGLGNRKIVDRINREHWSPRLGTMSEGFHARIKELSVHRPEKVGPDHKIVQGVVVVDEVKKVDLLTAEFVLPYRIEIEGEWLTTVTSKFLKPDLFVLQSYLCADLGFCLLALLSAVTTGREDLFDIAQKGGLD